MREIKFRAWDKVSKVMKHWDDYSPPTLLLEEALFDVEDGVGFKNDYELMQYTGLKDKNGQEIYEGDVVLLKDEIARGDGQYDDEIGQVVFDTDEACFMFKSDMGTEYLGHAHPDEVIGNIYENPELIDES